MVAIVKLVIFVMLLVFVDLIIQQVTGGEYGIIAVAAFLVQVILAFIGLIIHAIVNSLDSSKWDLVRNDITLIISGFIALFVWAGKSFIAVMDDIISLPFEILAQFMDGRMGLNLPIVSEDIGVIQFDVRTITLLIAFGNIENYDLFGVSFTLKNTIGFSLLGNSDFPVLKGFDGSNYTWLKSNIGRLAVILDFKNGAETCFPDLVGIIDCISKNLPPLRDFTKCLDPASDKYKCFPVSLYLETPAGWKVVSLVDEIFLPILNDISVPSLGIWVDTVYATLSPEVSISNISMFIQQKLEEFDVLCLKRKVHRNIGLI